MKNKKGFTLIELVLVIAILGILAVSALPNIFNISITTARDNSRDAVVGAIQAALSLYGASQLSQGNAESYPASLDAQAVATPAARDKPLFGTVLKGGITRDWTKNTTICYQYTGGGATDLYKLDTTNGTFLFVTVCP